MGPCASVVVFGVRRFPMVFVRFDTMFRVCVFVRVSCAQKFLWTLPGSILWSRSCPEPGYTRIAATPWSQVYPGPGYTLDPGIPRTPGVQTTPMPLSTAPLKQCQLSLACRGLPLSLRHLAQLDYLTVKKFRIVVETSRKQSRIVRNRCVPVCGYRAE